jgi:hypothetical protein
LSDTAACQRLLKAIGENIHRFEVAHGEIKDTEQPPFRLILVLQDKHNN